MLIADAYDVMTTGRIYKKQMGKDDAIKELKRCTGTQFDPILVDKFIEILST
jgi:HD-GYP domain-containing protein (c-di-GMP phosphodiesterase class II)